VHVAREGDRLAAHLADYRIAQFSAQGEVRGRVCGRGIRPLSVNEHRVDRQRIRTYMPWGQLALLAGGFAGYECVRENDLQGIAPARGIPEAALGDQPVLIMIDETDEGRPAARRKRQRQPESGPNLFALSNGEGPEGPAPSQTRQQCSRERDGLIRERSATD
jgi:hypothetical protein